MNPRRGLCWLALLTVALVPWATLGARDSSSSQPNNAFPQKINGNPADYVGSDSCKECHQGESDSFVTGPHRATLKNKEVTQRGCESCHGPGKAHVDSGGEALETLVRFDQVSIAQASAQCLDCHQAGQQSNRARSAHMKNNVGCLQCHSMHSPKVKVALLSERSPELCYTCHLQAKADFVKPFHHRVNEHLVSCTDCHNPHGGFLQHSLRATAAQDATCFTCHADKAGPFVFEHAPVKTEGCVSCHEPHGSTNPRLLKRNNVNLTCLECHTFTADATSPAVPAFHTRAQKYQACTMCHAQIHGSNQSEWFFK